MVPPAARGICSRPMRVLRVFATGVLTATLIVVGSGGASAAGGFCDEATKAYENLSDPSAITNGNLDELIDTYKDFEKTGPKKLRAAFKTLRTYYEDVVSGDIDVTDPDAVQEIGQKVAKASAKVFKYLANKCDLDVPELDK